MANYEQSFIPNSSPSDPTVSCPRTLKSPDALSLDGSFRYTESCCADDILMDFEPVEICTTSALTIVGMDDTFSYRISFLPTLKGFGAWRAGKVD